MSWDVSIEDDAGEYLEVDHFEGEGGTYALGGSSLAELNVTYNYGQLFRQAMPHLENGFNSLQGMSLELAYQHILEGCSVLPDDPAPDYWATTPGNAGHALHILRGWIDQGLRTEKKLRIKVF